jgi:hypothetical protein
MDGQAVYAAALLACHLHLAKGPTLGDCWAFAREDRQRNILLFGVFDLWQRYLGQR